MKFTHGAWQWSPGVEHACVRRVAWAHAGDGALRLAAVDRSGRDGIDRVEGLVLEIRVTSPMPDVLRVQVRHHRPATRGVTRFDLDYALRADGVAVTDTGDALQFTSGRLAVRFARDRWDMRLLAEGRPLTGAAEDGLGYMTVGGDRPFLAQRLDLGVGECIYGMGERFGPLVRNGQSVAIWNEDGGTVSDLAYKNVPFYLSSRGYGVLVNSPGRVEFEVATERVSQMQFSVPGETLDYYLFYGPSPKDVLEKYTRLAGRPALPPAWSFGLWLSTSFTTRYREDTVADFVDGMAERGIPLSVFHFDCFWMKERQWCDFAWDRDAFPHPQAMLARLKARGLKVCVWINPYVSQLSPLFDEGRDLGYFLRRRDGSVYQVDGWQPGMAFVDFTHPAAVAWYRAKLRALLEMGVDAFKTDFGERIPADAVYYDGSDPTLMHNYYAYLYNRAVFELLEEFHGKGHALVFARAATAGSQKFPVHWGGDCEATFESMAEALRGGLSFCLSGPAFWSHDIGGFTGTADPAVYKRWVAFGLLSTHSRLHGNESYRVPWLFDEEAVAVMRRFARLKNRLFPYLFAAARDARDRGWPVMRAMFLEFPDDPGCRYLDRQYMLGSSLLVAPVFRADGVAEYYLPPGRWTGLLDHAVRDGGRWVREAVDFMHLPLFARENAMIAMSGDATRPAWGLADELTLHTFALADGAASSAEAFADDALGLATFHVARRGAAVTFTSSGAAANVRVLWRSADPIVSAENGTLLDSTAEGRLVAWSDPARPLRLRLATPAAPGDAGEPIAPATAGANGHARPPRRGPAAAPAGPGRDLRAV